MLPSKRAFLYTEDMPVPTTAWANPSLDATHWPKFPDQDTAGNTWDYEPDTWDNAADTWDVFFASGSDENPATTLFATEAAPANTPWANPANDSTAWGNDTAPPNTAWTPDL